MDSWVNTIADMIKNRPAYSIFIFYCIKSCFRPQPQVIAQPQNTGLSLGGLLVSLDIGLSGNSNNKPLPPGWEMRYDQVHYFRIFILLAWKTILRKPPYANKYLSRPKKSI